MGFIDKVVQETNFESSIESLKPSTQAGINNTLKIFTKYIELQGSTLKEAIEEMKILKNKKDSFKALQS